MNNEEPRAENGYVFFFRNPSGRGWQQRTAALRANRGYHLGNGIWGIWRDVRDDYYADVEDYIIQNNFRDTECRLGTLMRRVKCSALEFQSEPCLYAKLGEQLRAEATKNKKAS